MLIAGIDEAGLGALAGPLVVAVVVLPADRLISGVRDSKTYSSSDKSRMRERLFDAACRIRKEALYWAVEARGIEGSQPRRVHISAISGCALRARARFSDCRVIVDGDSSLRVPGLANHQTLVKADRTIHAVSAASLLAKSYQVNEMAYWAQTYPDYGFDQHHGYPTVQHKTALMEYGACPMHRKSYVESFLSPKGKQLRSVA